MSVLQQTDHQIVFQMRAPSMQPWELSKEEKTEIECEDAWEDEEE